MSGWKPGTDKFIQTHELFVTIWRKLQDEGDENNDGLITAEEWVMSRDQISTSLQISFTGYLAPGPYMNHQLLIHTLASNVAKIQRAMPEAGQQG